VTQTAAMSPPPGRQPVPRGLVTVPGAADRQQAVKARGPGTVEVRPGTVEVRKADLDEVIERIFAAGVLLSKALASEVDAVAGVEGAIGELDETVRTIRSMVFAAWEPADDLGALAVHLDKAANEASRLASKPVRDIGVQLRDAAYSVHRAQVAVSEACSVLTGGSPAPARALARRARLEDR
jgi:hypothetical protein